ncbi:unnamed protein product [Caenorhabditis nigoni]
MNISHFANLDILVKTLSSQDVGYLKTNLLQSASFQKFHIAFRESEESLHTPLGEPYRIVSDSKRVWYFRFPYTDYYIHIVLNNPGAIVFTKVSKEDTPFFN